MKIQRTSSLVSLLFVEMLERFSYYGMRAVLILYLIDETGLALSKEVGFSYLGTFIVATGIMVLPMSLLSDFVTGQRRGFIIGTILTAIGYFTLALPEFVSLFLGLGLVAIGSGFMRPNIIVLLGQLYPKTNKQRDVGFLLFYAVINIGAFLGILGVGYLGEIMGWAYGFSAAGMAMIAALFIFIFGTKKIQNFEMESEENANLSLEDGKILDTPEVLIKEPTIKKTKNSSPILLILIIFLPIIFWRLYDQFSSVQTEKIEKLSSFIFLGTEYSATYLSFIPLICFIFITAFFSILWSNKNSTTSFQKIGFGFIFLSIAGVFVSQMNPVNSANLSSTWLFLLSFAFFQSIAEIFISPIIFSYLTRLSPLKYASTFIGLFYVTTYIPQLFESCLPRVFREEINIPIYSYILIALIIGTLLLIFKNQLKNISNGID